MLGSPAGAEEYDVARARPDPHLPREDGDDRSAHHDGGQGRGARAADERRRRRDHERHADPDRTDKHGSAEHEPGAGRERDAAVVERAPCEREPPEQEHDEGQLAARLLRQPERERIRRPRERRDQRRARSPRAVRENEEQDGDGARRDDAERERRRRFGHADEPAACEARGEEGGDSRAGTAPPGRPARASDRGPRRCAARPARRSRRSR
jgi:hypothetical protein